MSNEKTIWNNSLFSDRYKTQSNSDENFQTMNMIYKIKKIKKNKKPKLENYKGIELLQNINDVEKDQEKEINNEPIIEGLKSRVTTDDPNFLGLPDKDFDGVDKPSKKDNSKDPRVMLSNFIDNIFKKIDKFNYNKAYLFARAFSGTKPERSDVMVVKKYIGWFETILLSYFACYNWFFLMYYRYNHNDNDNVEPELLGHRYKTPILDTYDFQNKSFSRIDFWGMIYKFINYFFIYCLMFVEYLQNIMMEKIPNICKIIFNLKGCFIIVFIIMLFFIQYCSKWLFTFLKDILKGNTNNIVIGMMFFILILGYFFGTYNFGYIVKTPGYTFHSFADFFMGLPFSLITAFMRFIFIMLTSVPIGGILCVFYILYQSFFGILFNVGITSIFGITSNQKNIFEKINEFIKDNNESKKSPIKNVLNFTVDRFLYSNVLSITFMIIFICAIADYVKPKFIKNDNLRFNLIIITISFILFFIYIISRQIYLDFNDNINPIPTSEKNEETLGFFAEINKLVSDLAEEILKPIIEKAEPLVEQATKTIEIANNIGESANNFVNETTNTIKSVSETSKTFKNAAKAYTDNISKLPNELTSKIPEVPEIPKMPEIPKIPEVPEIPKILK
jgi:hypothetical protein